MLPSHGHNGRSEHKPRFSKLLTQMQACLPNKPYDVQKGANAWQILTGLSHRIIRPCYAMKMNNSLILASRRPFAREINVEAGSGA